MAKDEVQETALDIKATPTIIDRQPKENKSFAFPTDKPEIKSELIPHVTASVDQLEQMKQLISDNKGQVLASMLTKLPVPTTKPINLSEFCELFDLTYLPDASVAKELDKVSAPFTKWLSTFGFSYRNVVEAISKVNTNSSFDGQLNDVASIINSRPESLDTFRQLFN